MAYSYMFCRPVRLPLETDELSEETVIDLDDPALARAALDGAVPGIQWVGSEGRVTVDGMWTEFQLPDGVERTTLWLRCSLRADFRAFVQRLCDTLGWVAFSETPECFQPGRPPMPA